MVRVFAENFGVYGVRKVWRQMNREGFAVSRCTIARLMRDLGLQGVIRGKPVRTTISNKAAPCPLDHVNRQFHAPAPNMLWVSDFPCVATWAGFVYVAFVINVYARYIVGRGICHARKRGWRTRHDSNVWPLPSELELQRYARLFNSTLEHSKSLFMQCFLDNKGIPDYPNTLQSFRSAGEFLVSFLDPL